MQISWVVLCFTIHPSITSAPSVNPSQTSSTALCKLRREWVNNLTPSMFDATQDCLSLSKILETATRDSRSTFCAADPDVVSAYISSSLSKLGDRHRPRACEVRQWYYGTYGGRLRKPFCQNATEIWREVDKSRGKDPTPARTQPYLTVFHGPRSLCARRFTSDLKSMGDPDLVGPGVLVSQIMGMAFLVSFSFAAQCATKFPTVISLLKSTRHFYAIAALLSCSTATAALATFLQRRSMTKSLYSNFRYFDLYVNLWLVLAPAISVIPVVVLVLMPPKVPSQGGNADLKLWDKESGKNTKMRLARLSATLLYLLCTAIMWTIWGLGVCGQRNPTQVVFGGNYTVHVSSFIYKHAGTYVLLVCILMTALPGAALAALASLSIWYSLYRPSDRPKHLYLSILRNTCRNIFILFGIVQITMAAYIRSQSIHQAKGATSETQWGFGQILLVFTWLPLILSIGSNISSACFGRQSSRATDGHNTGLRTVQSR